MGAFFASEFSFFPDARFSAQNFVFWHKIFRWEESFPTCWNSGWWGQLIAPPPLAPTSPRLYWHPLHSLRGLRGLRYDMKEALGSIFCAGLELGSYVSLHASLFAATLGWYLTSTRRPLNYTVAAQPRAGVPSCRAFCLLHFSLRGPLRMPIITVSGRDGAVCLGVKGRGVNWGPFSGYISRTH